MAHNLKYSVAAKNAKLNNVGLNVFIGIDALLRLYDGAQPASPDVALSGQNLLCELPCNHAAFGTVATGILTANAITASVGAAAAAGGVNANWFRLFKADGATAVLDGTVGINGGGFDIEMNNPNIAQSQPVTVTGLTVTEGN